MNDSASPSAPSSELPVVLDKENPLSQVQFSDAERQRIAEIRQKISADDPQVVTQFGVSVQKNLSGFADSMLNQVRAKDGGQAGEVISDLMVQFNRLDVEGFAEDFKPAGKGGRGFLASLPVIGNMFDAVERFVSRYDTVKVQIDSIISQLDKSRIGLMKDIEMLEALYQKNEEFYRELVLYIAAGKERLKELREEELPKLEEQAKNAGDAMEAQKVADLRSFVDRFDRKLHDLELTRTIAVQTAPQIRLIQNNNTSLVEKIQSSILTTIPLWKNQIIIAISLARQKEAVEMQRKVSDTTNELLKQNADLLQQTTTDVARETERGVVEIETLKEVNNKLINTVEDAMRIHEEGRRRRREAETELLQIENELKTRLTQTNVESLTS